jgi:hypothetical protein
MGLAEILRRSFTAFMVIPCDAPQEFLLKAAFNMDAIFFHVKGCL